MPRPLKEDPRDCIKTFRFTHAEVTRAEGRARAAGQTLSDYVRRQVLDGAPAAAVSTAGRTTAPPRDDRRGHTLAEQLRKVGVNLNQIAHRMNELRIPPPRELTLILDDIRAYVRQAQEL